MDIKRKRIVLVTSSQPSLNPRMVKEADALASAGYEVIVVGQYWNDWATKADQILLKNKQWTFIRVGGSPHKDMATFTLTRISHRISRQLNSYLGSNFGLAEGAIGRCTRLLYAEALKQKADLYIGHNPGGLAPAVNAAKKNKVKCGFDAEDFHRHEYSDDPSHPDVLRKTFLEEKYFSQADYLTAASPLIGKEYEKIFGDLNFTPIVNVFPKPTHITVQESQDGKPLKLFWFSQTLGHNRGIAEIIEAMGIANNPLIELHLLANPREENISFFNKLARKFNLAPHQIVYHPPIPSEELFSFAVNYDIGLASEPGFNLNNNIALSNKLFTYIASGLAVLYSNTTAQESFMFDYPDCGKVYDKKDPHSLAQGILFYLNNRTALNQAKQASYAYGQNQLNWETESKKFLKLVEETLES